jgi:cytoskeletal protein RodZ
MKKLFRRHRRLVLIILAILVLAAVGGGGYWWKHRSDSQNTAKHSSSKPGTRPQNSIDYGPAKASDNQATNDQKQNNPSKVGTPLDQSSGSASFSVTVTRATVDTTDKQLIVGTLIDGGSSGTCIFKATKSGQADVSATNQVAQNGNEYTCPNFIIPFSQFPASGDWQVSVTVSSGGKSQTGTWGQAVNIPSN